MPFIYNFEMKDRDPFKISELTELTEFSSFDLNYF